MNDAGESCYPSVRTVARETGLARKTVMAHLRQATAAGWITTRAHGFRGQIWRRNEYAISWPAYVDAQKGGHPGLPRGGHPG